MAQPSPEASDSAPHHRTVGTAGNSLPSAVSEGELQVPSSAAESRSPLRSRQQPWVRRLCSCFYPPTPEVKPPSPLRTPRKRLTLVLDLDETLIHSSPNSSAFVDFSIPSESQGKQTLTYVRLRPGVAAFLQRVARMYEIVVYTASIETYARAILKQLDPNCLVSALYTREQCRKVEGVSVKDLSIIGQSLANIVLIDVIPT